MPLYFAYGSNMDRAAMAARCPASQPFGLGRLARHRFVVTREGYASVLRDPRRTVWGLVWDIAFADMPALDRYESVATGLYAKTVQPVLTARGPRRALVYVARSTVPGVPRPDYMEGVVAAAAEAGLPEAYRRELEAWVPTARPASGPAEARRCARSGPRPRASARSPGADAATADRAPSRTPRSFRASRRRGKGTHDRARAEDWSPFPPPSSPGSARG